MGHPLRALLFDADGTLIDSPEDIAASANFVRARFALPPLSVAEITRMVGLGITVLMERALGKDCPVPAEELVEIFRGHYWDHCLDHTVLYDGVRETLDGLDRYSLAVVSNKPERFTRKILEGLGVAHHFPVILGGDSTPERKPHPEPIFRALQDLDVPPQEAMMIGDTPVDIDAGRRAGVRTCGVTYGLVDRAEIEGANPHHVIHAFRDLTSVLPSPRGDADFLRGIDLFRERRFFDAHEALEEFWNRQGGEEKVFAQGLIQAAVACHHLCNGNVRGAVSLFESSRAKLAPRAPACLGLRVDLLLQQMEGLFGPLDPETGAPPAVRGDDWPRPVWLGEAPLGKRDPN